VSEIDQLARILKRLNNETGRKFDASEFWSRFRIQKSIYLLQATGYPRKTMYKFNLYLRGPYSPDLAKDYYSIDTWSEMAKRSVSPADIPEHNLSVVKEAIDRGEYFLETLVTIHSIKETEGTDKERTFEIARRLKPNRIRYFEQAWDFLSDWRLV
jgi:uncharacterized protein YwgA